MNTNEPANMPITLTSHQVNPANDRLTITVLDERGSGGAHHAYEIDGLGEDKNPFFRDPKTGEINSLAWQDTKLIVFQNGPIAEVGVNGITHEALLAILEHRLECFQAGPYACLENAQALLAIKSAQAALHNRTRARMARQVEGQDGPAGRGNARGLDQPARAALAGGPGA